METIAINETGDLDSKLRVVICGSYGDLDKLYEVLGDYRQKYSEKQVFPTDRHLVLSKPCIEAHHGKKEETIETLSIRSKLMIEYFHQINDADLVVIINEKKGKEYYGTGTIIELGYAFAKEKKISFTKEPSNSNILSLMKINKQQFKY